MVCQYPIVTTEGPCVRCRFDRMFGPHSEYTQQSGLVAIPVHQFVGEVVACGREKAAHGPAGHPFTPGDTWGGL